MPLPLIPIIIGGIGLAVTTVGGLVADATWNKGNVLKTLMSPIEASAKNMQEIQKEAGFHGFYELIDQLGEFLTGIFGRNSFTDGIRNFGQKMQGINEEDRVFGTQGSEEKGGPITAAQVVAPVASTVNVNTNNLGGTPVSPSFNQAAPPGNSTPTFTPPVPVPNSPALTPPQ